MHVTGSLDCLPSLILGIDLIWSGLSFCTLLFFPFPLPFLVLVYIHVLTLMTILMMAILGEDLLYPYTTILKMTSWPGEYFSCCSLNLGDGSLVVLKACKPVKIALQSTGASSSVPDTETPLVKAFDTGSRVFWERIHARCVGTFCLTREHHATRFTLYCWHNCHVGVVLVRPLGLSMATHRT